jgi:hypothetical protein
VHKSASDRAFELFFHAGRELDGVGEKGVRALQNLLAQAEGAGPVEIMAALFPPQDEQAGEEPDAEDQASESASV